jgi:hypothetical protein
VTELYERAHSDRTTLENALLRVESAAKTVAADVRVPQRCVDDLIAAVAKDGTNPHFKSQFVTLDALIAAGRAILPTLVRA